MERVWRRKRDPDKFDRDSSASAFSFDVYGQPGVFMNVIIIMLYDYDVISFICYDSIDFINFII